MSKDLTKKLGDLQIGIEHQKHKDLPKWYHQILTKSEMLDYYDVSGCYILRPNSYFVWEQIQKQFNEDITKMEVENVYFPMFVSKKVLEKEKDHIEGFAPEVAWVTRAGDSDLAEPVAIRPTSETIMYPAYAKWIQSKNQLPLKLNQWNNVIRWEFKNPTPFLRTREFLWQEGHTAHYTLEEAGVEVLQILDLYASLYEDLLAVPVIKGVKSEKEKFAGGYYTTTVEAYIKASGRGIQGGTSHCLGQNFSKMFNIVVEGDDGAKSFVWQNSWGFSTRSIGVMVMVHGDDKGMVFPPRVAKIQVIIVACGIVAKTTTEEKQAIWNKCNEEVARLKKAGIRAASDLRENYSPGYKFNHWELRGVPIRLEIGPRDIAKNEARCVHRVDGSKAQISLDNIAETIQGRLDDIQAQMLRIAAQERDANLVYITKFDDIHKHLDEGKLILAPWCENVECEERVKKDSTRAPQEGVPVDEKSPSMGAKTLCIPYDQKRYSEFEISAETKCFACSQSAKRWTLWGRSY